jgi:hypothetical protein
MCKIFTKEPYDKNAHALLWVWLLVCLYGLALLVLENVNPELLHRHINWIKNILG